MNAGHAEFAAEVARIRRRREAAAALDAARRLRAAAEWCGAQTWGWAGHGDALADLADTVGALPVDATAGLVEALVGPTPAPSETWRDYQHERDQLAAHYRTLFGPVTRHDTKEIRP